MRVRIPEEIPGGGNDLKIMSGPFHAVFKDALVKKAKSSGEPIAILRWILTTEPQDGQDYDFPTTGEMVLDTYSLQDQALWRLNNLHKDLLGKNIPPDDYDPDAFKSYLNDAFQGQEVVLNLTIEPDQKGNDRTKVESVAKL